MYCFVSALTNKFKYQSAKSALKFKGGLANRAFTFWIKASSIYNIVTLEVLSPGPARHISLLTGLRNDHTGRFKVDLVDCWEYEKYSAAMAIIKFVCFND